MKIWGDPGGSGRILRTFPEKVQNGPLGPGIIIIIIWAPGGPWALYLGVSGPIIPYHPTLWLALLSPSVANYDSSSTIRAHRLAC